MTFYSSLFPYAFIYIYYKNKKKNTVYNAVYYYYYSLYIRFGIPCSHRNILHISPKFSIDLIDRKSKNIKTIKQTVNTLRFVYMSSDLYCRTSIPKIYFNNVYSWPNDLVLYYVVQYSIIYFGNWLNFSY